MIVQTDFARRKAKTLSDVDNGEDPSSVIDNAQNDGRRVWKRRDLNHPNYSLHRRESQRITLLIQGKNDKRAWLNHRRSLESPPHLLLAAKRSADWVEVTLCLVNCNSRFFAL